MPFALAQFVAAACRGVGTAGCAGCCAGTHALVRLGRPNRIAEVRARREKLDTLPCQKLFFQFAVLSFLLLFGRFGIVRGHTFHLRPPLCRFLFLQPPPISASVIRMCGHALRERGGELCARPLWPNFLARLPIVQSHAVEQCRAIAAELFEIAGLQFGVWRDIVNTGRALGIERAVLLPIGGEPGETATSLGVTSAYSAKSAARCSPWPTSACASLAIASVVHAR